MPQSLQTRASAIMSGNLSNKVKLLTQLVDQANSDQSELLIALTKILEDQSKEQGWAILTARRMILASLDTHHPNIDITNSWQRLKIDHNEENERRRKDRTNMKEINTSHYS